MAQLGVYIGNDASAVTAFENWLGRPVDGVQGVVGAASWDDFRGSSGWAADTLWSQIDCPVFWSVPLIVNGATLEDAAKGLYNEHYKHAARELADHRPQDGDLYIRTGWEFNGDWFPWKAEGKEQAFIGAFRQFVDSFRSVSDRFVFEWNVNASDGYGQRMDPATAYPGDDYVDIIGMDFYYNTQWDSADPTTAWNEAVHEKYGLQWHQDFAAAHGKPTAYSEWGVTTDNMAPYIEQAKAWFESHNVIYQTYWDSDAAYPGKLSDNSDPNSGNAYIRAFSGLGAATALVTQSDGHTIWSTISYTLEGHRERNLTLTETANIYAVGNEFANVLRGNSGHNLLDGGPGGDQIVGGSGNDRLHGGEGADNLSGEAGNDALNGGRGSDKLRGGFAKDKLMGGAGADRFIFDEKETGAIEKTADYILDFRGKLGDKIDVSLVDANSRTRADNKFAFLGEKDAFSATGQVRYEQNKANTWVYINTDADAAAEAVIRLAGSFDLKKEWFVL